VHHRYIYLWCTGILQLISSGEDASFRLMSHGWYIYHPCDVNKWSALPEEGLYTHGDDILSERYIYLSLQMTPNA
jgi:hypothetical protein